MAINSNDPWKKNTVTSKTGSTPGVAAYQPPSRYPAADELKRQGQLANQAKQFDIAESQKNARLLAENPTRENASSMLAGLRPEDYNSLAMASGNVSKVTTNKSGTTVTYNNAGTQDIIKPKDRAFIEDKINTMVKSRIENLDLPAGIVPGKNPGEYIDQETKEPVDVRAVLENEARSRIYGDYESAAGQIHSSTDPRSVLAGAGRLYKMGLSPLDQMATNLPPTKGDMSGIQVSQGGQSLGNYNDWLKNNNVRTVQNPTGVQRNENTPGYGKLTFSDTGVAPQPPAQQPSSVQGTVADTTTATPAQPIEDVLAGLRAPEKQQTVGEKLLSDIPGAAKQAAKQTAFSISPMISAGVRGAQAISGAVKQLKDIISKPADTPERRSYFSNFEKNFGPIIQSSVATSDKTVNELRSYYKQYIEKGNQTPEQALENVARLLEKKKRGEDLFKKIPRDKNKQRKSITSVAGIRG